MTIEQTKRWWFHVNDLSPDEITFLRTSFAAIKNNLDKVATDAFLALYDEQPGSFAVFIHKKQYWPKSRDEVGYSWETKQHGLRVLSTVERLLSRIDRPDEFASVVSALAVRHVSYGATPCFVLSLVGCFRSALITELEQSGKFNNQQEGTPAASTDSLSSNMAPSDVWNKFFKMLGLAMVGEMLEIQQQRQQVRAISQSVSSSFPASQPDEMSEIQQQQHNQVRAVSQSSSSSFPANKPQNVMPASNKPPNGGIKLRLKGIKSLLS